MIKQIEKEGSGIICNKDGSVKCQRDIGISEENDDESWNTIM